MGLGHNLIKYPQFFVPTIGVKHKGGFLIKKTGSMIYHASGYFKLLSYTLIQLLLLLP